jgi:chromosome segregation protein
MVKLERLVLQGFKSFKKKSSIPFPTGFSAITGPNGSGKSNILDSICFVLGKSSSRTMRAKKGQDLIFHGSKVKKGSDYASVVLYFNNSDKKLPLDEKEVSIGRRINGKGVSTYRLNGKIVTRQQVVDLLSQASVHPDGHNIIQQGDVNQIVEMDAVERRGVIDYISGISEYEEKKNKAVKELDKIAEKVREAEILLNEKGSVMEKLRQDRDAALKYKELEGNLGKIRDSIVWKEYSSSNRSLGEVTKRIDEREGEFEKIEKDIKEYDDRLVEEEKKLESLTKDVVKASGQIEVTKRITKLQSEIEMKRDKIDSNNRETERLENLIERISSVDNKISPGLKAVLGFQGVHGTLGDLIQVPSEYRIAVEVAAASHLRDIVVSTTSNAVKCIRYLKQNKLGRARFLPLDKIQGERSRFLPAGSLGWLSELIHHEPKYDSVVNYVFGRTACVNDIEKAREIIKKHRVRMVTLDGDLVEASGAMTGGFYKKRTASFSSSEYEKEIRDLQKANEKIEGEIIVLNKELDLLSEKERKTSTFSFEKERVKLDNNLKEVREARKASYEKRLVLQQEIGKLNVNRAKLEAKFDNLKLQVTEGEEEKLKPFVDMGVATLKEKERETIEGIQEIGPVNMKSLEEFDSIKVEFEEFKERVDKIVDEKLAIEDTIDKIEARRKETFDITLNSITKNFKEVYSDLTGGEAELVLDDPNNIDTGLMIRASPPGKRLLNIDSMSGGEKTLTAFAFVFAIQKHKPAPFYILDEADATLDKINTRKLVNLLKKQSKHAQFIIISHNDTLVREADQIYGVTMESGESKIMGIELPSEIRGN